MEDGKGYLLPEVIDPAGSKCVLINLPDDQNHIAAFWGQMEALAYWYTWQRDDLKQGKDAAAVWQQVIADARATFLSGECGSVQLKVRVNPADPCELQYSEDGGQQWVTFAVIDDCTAPGTPYTPYPPNTPDAGEKSAATLAQYYEDLVCIAVAGLDNGDPNSTIITAMQTHLTDWGVSGVPDAVLQDIIDNLSPLTPAQRAAYCNGDIANDIGSGAICAGVVGMNDGSWLDDAANWISSTLNNWSQWLIDALNSTAGYMGIGDQNNISASYGGGGGAGIAGPEECFDLIWNFFAGTPPFPWEISANHVSSAGVYTGSVGYTATYGPEADPPDDSKGTSIKLWVQNLVRINYVEIWTYFNKTTTGDPNATAFYHNFHGSHYEISWNSYANGYNTFIDADTVGAPIKYLNTSLRSAFEQDAGSATIRRIRIKGIGLWQYA